VTVYSEDRVRRLLFVLAVEVVLGAVLALLAASVLWSDATNMGGIVSLVASSLMLGAGGASVLLLRDAEQPAKVACIVTGAICVLAAIGSAGSILSLLLALLGLGLLLLALLPDEPRAHR
jgi:hypothetical protein